MSSMHGGHRRADLGDKDHRVLDQRERVEFDERLDDGRHDNRRIEDGMLLGSHRYVGASLG